MSEEKLCPHCGKKLRRDNTRGACSACLAGPKGKRSPAEPKGRPAPVPAADASDVMTKFRAVCDALGKDPDAILAEAAQGWLDSLASLLDKANED